MKEPMESHMEWGLGEAWWSEDGNWLRITPVWVTNVRKAMAVAWVAVGWETATPWRPCPQLGMEVRRGRSILAWFVFCGVSVCIQSVPVLETGPKA